MARNKPYKIGKQSISYYLDCQRPKITARDSWMYLGDEIADEIRKINPEIPSKTILRAFRRKVREWDAGVSDEVFNRNLEVVKGE